MAKKKTSNIVKKSLENLSKLDLDKVSGLTRSNPLEYLADPREMALAVFQCLMENDPDGAMEMIDLYLKAINKLELRNKTNLHKSTMYSVMKHRNPTIRTLAKIMYGSMHQ